MGLLDIWRARSPEDQFADRVMRRLKTLGWPHRLAYVPETFSIVTDDRGGTFNLANVFRDLQMLPRRDQAAQLDRAIAFLFEVSEPASFEEAAPRLIPIVRNLTQLQAMALEGGDKASTELWQPFRPLAGQLAAMLGVDSPTSISLLSHDLLHRWGCGADVVFERALENLVAMSPVSFEPTAGGFLVASYRDRHDSSRLLMPELFRALQLHGDPVAVAVSRDLLVVAGSDDIKALNAMAAFVVEAFNKASRPTSWLPIVLRGDEWQPFEASLTPEYASVRDLSIREQVWNYGLQTPRLEAFLHMKGEDVFVAPLEVLMPRGDAYTWTSWTENVPALLPRAHALGLTDSAERRLVRLWSDVEAVCGSFIEDRTFHPPRFRPPPWPSEDAWRRLETEFATPEWWEQASSSP
jgi:hypothetical protein